MSIRTRTTALAISVTVAMMASCMSGGKASLAPTTTTTVPATTASTLPPSIVLAAFGTLEEVSFLADTPAYAGPAWPTSLDGVVFVPPGLTRAAADRLARNGFVVVASDFFREFDQVYAASEYEPFPVFVTTDAAYHLWHLVFAKVLRDLERQALLPVLERFLAAFVAAARTQAADLSGTAVADAAQRVGALGEAAAELAGVDVGPVGTLAAEEVRLARAAATIEASPITASGPCNPAQSPKNCVDFSQMRPRGHYTSHPDLERYFRGMALLGQEFFAVDDPASLRLAALVARVLDANPALAADWRTLAEPVGFLVGAADDYTPGELIAALDATGPWRDPAVLADDRVLERAGRALIAGRPVAINPEAAGVRVLGARFTLDAFVLDQLAYPNVDPDPGPRRTRVSALDVAAAFGSAVADRVQAGEAQAFSRYGPQLAAMRQLIAGRTSADWGRTVYDAWLWAIAPQWAARGAAYPSFMRSDAWAAKALQTGLGSYTELKHDTVLYVKQGFAAEGAGEPPPVPPRHWVEPDPVTFGRLAAVTRLLATGMAERGLLPADTGDLLDDLAGVFDRLRRIAADELAGRPISAADNGWLEAIAGVLEDFRRRLTEAPAVTNPSDVEPDAAVVADIFTTTEAALELGTGRVDWLYVLVPNDEGVFQVARGGVYSFYEFWQPLATGRLTDEQWRSRLDAGTAPPRPSWTSAFLAAP